MSVMPVAMAWAADLISRGAAPVGETLKAAIPAGYRELTVGDEKVFWPPADPSLPVLGLSPSPSGTAGPILATLLPDWRSANAWQSTSTGRTLSGIRCETTRGDFGRPGPDGTTYVTALSMVVSDAGQERLLWALGNPARAILDGEPLLRVLHGLPVADGTVGEGAQLIVGTWRLSTGYGVGQYTFRADGSFERGTSITTTLGTMERTTSAVNPGRFAVSAGILELTGDGNGRFLVRVCDELGHGAERPLRQLGLLPVAEGPEVTYALVG